MEITLRRQLCRLACAGFVAIVVNAAPALAQQQGDLTTSPLPQPDVAFARAAAVDSQSGIGLATLAQQITSSDIVKSFAESLQRDHVEASDKLRAIAGEKHVSLPIVESEATAMARVTLARLSGTAFDRAYLDAMVASQQDMIQRFERYARSGADPELRSYADTMLPKLRKHLAAARDARASI
jgi:putative membrane protein